VRHDVITTVGEAASLAKGAQASFKAACSSVGNLHGEHG
jgi:hypothetical protein